MIDFFRLLEWIHAVVHFLEKLDDDDARELCKGGKDHGKAIDEHLNQDRP